MANTKNRKRKAWVIIINRLKKAMDGYKMGINSNGVIYNLNDNLIACKKSNWGVRQLTCL